MAGASVLLTSTLALLAAAAFALAGAHLLRQREAALEGGEVRSRIEPLLFLLAAATLVPMALRELTSWLAQRDGAWEPLQTALFQALHVPAALSMVVLMHLTARRLSASRWTARAASVLYAALALVGLAFLYGSGLAGLHPEQWSVEGSIEREVALNMILAFFALPALMASGLLILAVQRTGGDDARRVRTLSLALTVFYMGFTMDAIGAQGLALLAPRLMTLGAAALAYLSAIHPPSINHAPTSHAHPDASAGHRLADEARPQPDV